MEAKHKVRAAIMCIIWYFVWLLHKIKGVFFLSFSSQSNVWESRLGFDVALEEIPMNNAAAGVANTGCARGQTSQTALSQQHEGNWVVKYLFGNK